MEERRVNIRTDLVFYLEIFEKTDNKILGRIGDISDTGLMILSDQELVQNSLYDVLLKLPENGDFAKREIEIEIRTKWQKPDFNPEYHCTGCELVRVKDDDVFIINSIIKQFGYTLGEE
jgi:hypothetical protein